MLWHLRGELFAQKHQSCHYSVISGIADRISVLEFAAVSVNIEMGDINYCNDNAICGTAFGHPGNERKPFAQRYK